MKKTLSFALIGIFIMASCTIRPKATSNTMEKEIVIMGQKIETMEKLIEDHNIIIGTMLDAQSTLLDLIELKKPMTGGATL